MEKKHDLSDYYKVENYKFGLLRNGDFIRWEKNGKYTLGATIAWQTEYNGKKYWQLKSCGAAKTKFSLYWDTVPAVWVRKTAFYDDMSDQIKTLRATVLFLIKELELEQEFSTFNDKIKQHLSLEKDVKIDKIRRRRRNSTTL